ncbi:CBN-RNR-2 protein [Aphelenchoides avenae]|nr:CBN-RNR-2 protein [Aphelenchus avenae]
MKRALSAKDVTDSSKRVLADSDDGFYDSDEDLRLGDFIKTSSGEDFYDRDEDRRLGALIKASSGADFYDSDEDRRLSEFAAGTSCLSQTDSGSILRPADIDEHRADDDFVALYDGWEEDAEDIVAIPDEGDDAPFALQHGGFHGFNESEEEDEEGAGVEEEDAEMPADLHQYYEFVQSRRRWVKKFGVFGFATQFCLKTLERVDDVMTLLENIVQHLIDQAAHNADREGFQGWIGSGLKTEDGKQWYIFFRSAEQNTAQKIVRSIEKYDQSSNTTAFYGKRVTFDITYIKNELSYSSNVKDTILAAGEYYHDDAMDNAASTGFLQRNRLMGQSEIVELESRLDFDLANQNLFLLNNLDVLFTIYRHDDNFLIQSLRQGDTNTYRLKVHNIRLRVKTVDVNTTVNLAVGNTLEKTMAKYPVRKTEIRSCYLTPGRTEFVYTVFSHTRPRRIIGAMVNNYAYNGRLTLSPFKFFPYDVRTFEINVGG